MNASVPIPIYHLTRTTKGRMLLLLTLALPLTARAQSEASFKYETNDDGTITIAQYFGQAGSVTIPSATKGLTITRIGAEAFSCNMHMTNVALPDTVTSIGNHAFWQCDYLTGVALGNFLTNIEDHAFFDCRQLASIMLPNIVAEIGIDAFQITRLTNISIPSGLRSINEGVFAISDLTSVVIPDGVTNVGLGAFAYCRKLRRVVIGNGVTSIGGQAFLSCGLTNLAIPKNVTSIGDEAFGQCVALESIIVDPQNPFFTSVDGLLYDKKQTALLQCPGAREGAVEVPGTVTSIAHAAFAFCRSLTNIVFPNGVTNIPDETFLISDNLEGVYFRGNAPMFGTNVFYGDTNATVYYLPGTTGWTNTFAGRPTAPWVLPNPVMLTNAPKFGVGTNGFGFVISWATNVPVVVEASTDLGNWIPLATNTPTSGSSYFSDPQWTNYPARFYRLRGQ